jgi:hypothetical protein
MFVETIADLLSIKYQDGFHPLAGNIFIAISQSLTTAFAKASFHPLAGNFVLRNLLSVATHLFVQAVSIPLRGICLLRLGNLKWINISGFQGAFARTSISLALLHQKFHGYPEMRSHKIIAGGCLGDRANLFYSCNFPYLF